MKKKGQYSFALEISGKHIALVALTTCFHATGNDQRRIRPEAQKDSVSFILGHQRDLPINTMLYNFGGKIITKHRLPPVGQYGVDIFKYYFLFKI